MKKIAILTQPLGTNYGGILQNFALQHVIKEMGYEPITINRPKKLAPYIYYKAKIAQIILKHHKDKILSNKQRKIIAKNNISFIDKYINRIDIYNVSTKKLQNTLKEEKIDTVIVGSDQVWRPEYSPNIYNDFLDFVNGQEILAYAASFGTDNWEYNEEQTKICKDLSHRFKAISVREKSGVKLCKEYFNVDATWVLDPTLLLDKQTYRSLYSENKNSDESLSKKSLFTYILDDSEEKRTITNNIASALGLNINSNQAKKGVENNFKEKFVEEDFAYPPIENWIKGFDEADFIVTDSFHGTVFSIIFNKPFIAIINRERGASRFESLLESLGLENRLINNYNEKKIYNLLRSSINYETVNKKLEKLKFNSMSYLNKNIGISLNN